MRKRHLQLLLSSAVSLLLLAVALVTSVYAHAAYHGDWSEQPYYGNHWWFNGGQLVWDADDYWTTERLQSMQNGHNTAPYKEYQIEQEAYNPGSQSQCDRLVISSTEAMDLPVWDWSRENGCGDSAYLEELKIELDENAVNANTWLRHRVTYDRRNPGSGGDGEVNYSFSNNWSFGSDSWMGKITYNQNYDKLGSDPGGLVN